MGERDLGERWTCMRWRVRWGAWGLRPDPGEVLRILLFWLGLGVLKFFEGLDLGWEREGEIRLGLFEIERDKAWVGREMRGIRLGLCLGRT